VTTDRGDSVGGQFSGEGNPVATDPLPQGAAAHSCDESRSEPNLSHALAEAAKLATSTLSRGGPHGKPRWRLRRHQRVTGEDQPPLSTLRPLARCSFRVSRTPGGCLKQTVPPRRLARKERGPTFRGLVVVPRDVVDGSLRR
jgi:hypothetical protein